MAGTTRQWCLDEQPCLELSSPAGGEGHPAGTATLNLQMPVNQALCGATVTGQYAEFQVGACELVLTDGIAITIGN